MYRRELTGPPRRFRSIKMWDRLDPPIKSSKSVVSHLNKQPVATDNNHPK